VAGEERVEERGWAYRRRRPEGTVLYEAVKDNLATLLEDVLNNSHLAASEPLLASLGAAALLHLASARGPRATLSVALLLLAAPGRGLRASLRHSRSRSHDVVALGQYLRQHLPPSASLFAFEPAWGLAGDRLPASPPGAPLVVDVYAFMLQGALASGQSFSHVNEAFRSPAAQAPLRPLLEKSDALVLGWRGHWQLNEDSRQWLQARLSRPFPPPGQDAPDVWRRLLPVPPPAPQSHEGPREPQPRP
jgi:hypothetical protein